MQNKIPLPPIETQRSLAKASYLQGEPHHYHFSRRYYEGGYRCSEWVGFGFTGTEYYTLYYANMGTMRMVIPKEDYTQRMERQLENQQWDNISVGEPHV
jgi:hypothetical protein